jgi:uncharacterized protein
VKAREFDPVKLDVPAWQRDGRDLQGTVPLSVCRRLAAGLAAVPDGELQWTASIRSAGPGPAASRPELWLRVRAAVPLICQRCLQPLLHPLVVDRRFIFARDEDEAARLDEEIDDDVLVLERLFDLLALVEDELILTLPIVPRHDECPQPLAGPQVASEDDIPDAAPHPFAALAALKRGRR